MPTDELPREKRIADDPPIHPQELLENPGPAERFEEPPRTRLLIEGFDPEEITADFLADVHDLGDRHGLPVRSISVGQPDCDDQ